jgi:hypothetical protein
VGAEFTANGQAAIPRPFPLPAGIAPRRVVVTAGTHAAATALPADSPAGAGERLVYSSTFGNYALPLPANFRAADDLSLNARRGCALRRYSVDVSLKADPSGVAGPVTAYLALRSVCPHAGAPALAGTLAQVSFTGEEVEANPLVRFEYVQPDPPVVTTHGTLWLSVRFDRANAGPVMGAPALVGYSDDLFDIPQVPCNASLGGFPGFPHATFNAQVYIDIDCPAAFPAYRNIEFADAAFSEGPGVRIADDMELQVEDCFLLGYEVGVAGQAFYDLDLRYDVKGVPGTIIGNTNLGVPGFGGGPNVYFRIVDPPVRLTGSPNRVWVTLQPNVATGRWIRTTENAQLGYTAPSYAVYDGASWSVTVPTDGLPGAFYAVAYCAGHPPSGACCDMYLGDYGDAVCRELPQMNCPSAPAGSTQQPSWQEGAACEPDPFPHPCGTAVCCRRDETCENLTFDECMAAQPVQDPALWRAGVYCESVEQPCPPHVCFESTGPCATPRSVPGCDQLNCCDRICQADLWCCGVEWDALCVGRAANECPLPAVAGIRHIQPATPGVKLDRLSADTNGNFEVDLDDYWRFGNCLVDGFDELPAPMKDCLGAFDADGSGTLDVIDFAALQNVFGRADDPVTRE